MVIWRRCNGILPFCHDAARALLLCSWPRHWNFSGALTHWPMGDFNLIFGNFQANFSEWWLRYLLWNCPQMNVARPYWWEVNIGSDNGLVPSGNKPLPESMLTQIYVANSVTRPQRVNLSLVYDVLKVIPKVYVLLKQKHIATWQCQIIYFRKLLSMSLGYSARPFFLVWFTIT